MDVVRGFVGHPWWYPLGTVASMVGIVTALVFAVSFHRETGDGWRANPFGRFLMTRKILIAVLFGVVLINRWVAGDLWVRQYPPAWVGSDMLVSLLMLAFALQTYVPYRLLVQVQRDHQHQATDRRERADGDREGALDG